MKKNRINIKLLVLQLLIFFICLLSYIVCKVDILCAIKYFLFQFFFIYIPGYALFILLNHKEENDIIVWSYAYGIIHLIFQYWLFQVININSFSLYINISICLLSIVYINKKNDCHLYINDYYYFFILLVFILFIICFFSISCSNPLPTYNGGTNYNKDFLFWIGNSISFIKGLPVQVFTLVGNNYYYHYFSSIVIAQTNLCTGIDTYIISYYFSYIIPCILLVFSSYELLKKVISNNWLIIIGVVLILCTEGATTYLSSHLYFCPFGYDYAYAYGMLTISLLFDINNEENSYIVVFKSCLLLSIATGMKGPVAVVILMAYAFESLFLLLKKQYKKCFTYGMLWLLSFLIIYFLCITNIFDHSPRTNNLEFVGIVNSFDNNIWAIKNLNYLISNLSFPDNGITRVLALLLYVLRSNFPAMLMLFAYLIVQIINIRQKKNINNTMICLFASCIWGILLTIITHQDGNSQMYFIMSVYPCCVLLGLYSLESLNLDNKKMQILIVLVLCLSFTNIKRFIFDRALPEIKNGISVLNGNPDTSSYRYFFTENDYELSQWLKNNTESNDYIALDCFEYDGFRKELGFGVLSERFVWNDGQYANEAEKNRRRNIVYEVFEGDINSINKLKNENVKYLVQTISINPIFEFYDKLNVVFESDSYIVYKLY